MGGEGGWSAGGEDGVELGLDVEVAVGLSDAQSPPSHCAARPQTHRPHLCTAQLCSA